MTTRKTTTAASNEVREMLRSMPIDARAECLVGIFQIVAGEFAAMVLDYAKARPTKKPRRPRRAIKARPTA